MKNVVIKYSSKALKGKKSLSHNEEAILDVLEQDLRETSGKPYGRGWQSLSSLSKDSQMHCHLNYRKVAVWTVKEDSENIEITICRFEYIGTREKAPY